MIWWYDVMGWGDAMGWDIWWNEMAGFDAIWWYDMMWRDVMKGYDEIWWYMMAYNDTMLQCAMVQWYNGKMPIGKIYNNINIQCHNGSIILLYYKHTMH